MAQNQQQQNNPWMAQQPPPPNLHQPFFAGPGWIQLLARIGLNIPTSNEVCKQGLDRMEELLHMTEDDLVAIRTSVLRYPSPNRPQGAIVMFPYQTLIRLRTVRYWARMRTWQGLGIAANDCTDQELTAVEIRYNELAELKRSLGDTSPAPPSPLKSFKEWITWKAAFDSYAGALRGARDQPLTYLYRDEARVTPETRQTVYSSWDSHMHHCIVLQGQHYTLDNRRLWTELKMLTVDGTAWTYIKEFELSQNGRGAMLKLIQENGSTSGVTIRKSRAYAALQSLTYNGPKRQWDFTSYVTGHVNAHNELKECNEEPPQSKKVTDFLSGINDSTLASAVQMCGAHPDYAKDFTKTQQYLSAIAANQKVSDGRKRARGISGTNTGKSSATSNNKKRRGNDYSKKPRRTTNIDGPPATGVTLSGTATYSPDVWWSQLNQNQHDTVTCLREQSKSKRGASATNSTDETHEEDTPPDENPPKDAGRQFGRGAHKQKSGQRTSGK